MRSKLITTALVLTAGACGGVKDNDNGDYQVGREPAFYSTSYLWGAGDQNQVIARSKTAGTIERFTIEPFAHVSSTDLPLADEDQGVVASSDGQYVVTMAKTNYAIVKADGSVLKNPMPMVGEIVSVAFDPTHNYLVISDEFQTMTVLILTPAGDLKGAWKGGAKFGEDLLVKAGTMLSDGHLALSLGEKKLAIVDVEATVIQQSWNWVGYEIPDATDMRWMATVPEQPKVLMIVDGQRVLTVDTTNGAILSQKDLAGRSVRAYFRDYVPHMLVDSLGATPTSQDFATIGYAITIIFVDGTGQLVESSIRASDRLISQTMLAKDNTLTVVYDTQRDFAEWGGKPVFYKPQSVARFRLTDSAGLDKVDVDEAVNLVLTPSHMLLFYPSSLGKAVRRDYGTKDNDQVIEGYNLDHFQQ